MRFSTRSFFTAFGPESRKTGLSVALVLLLAACVAAGLAGCSTGKNAQKKAKATASSSPFDNNLMGGAQEDVRKKLGDPTVVSRTMEDHILWVYVPKWKIIPNDKGTLYVEFVDGKVTKIFRKK